MATTVTAQDIQSLSCEFEGCDEAFLQRFIDQACRRLDEAFWGSLYDDAVLYLTAHLAASARAGSSGISGPITSKEVGELKVAFGSNNANSGLWWQSTAWGRELHAMQSSLCFQSTPRVI